MFRYRLHSPDGDDPGEATYAMMIKPGGEILYATGQRMPAGPAFCFWPASHRSGSGPFAAGWVTEGQRRRR
jgi:hypothetical protein